ncbi:DUF6336 family protein [Streptomyces violaceus]|uniref:DUF6336 family protein n=1 Tax=Streptomyces violaceus TaxID=1936 RepID=A0ABY9UP85_STRVL|nr:DUF6336 family protein [Streptomyces janthinus]WND23595.1 DUF6336 family protein [Streptomyces janthinus]GGS95600.1 hypothetical protein GCM10010270_79450 [Streptomyces janthinus]
MRTEDAIIRPLLPIRDVASRGALYGLAAVPLLGVASLFVDDHHRTTFLGVVGLLAAFSAVVEIFLGLFCWWTCGGDIRRSRDCHTVTGQAGPITVAAPVLLRVAVLALVLFPSAFGLHHLVDGAEYGSWL